MKPTVRNLALVLSATVVLAAVGAQQEAAGQVSCDDGRVAERLPKPPNGCHSERVTASGNQRPTIAWAQRSAEDAWKDQVLTKFGERFRVYANAACAKQECVPGAITGMYRCTFSGFPCAVRPSIPGTLELSASEVEEMQRLLGQKGFKVTVDGKLGPKTQQALERWQRREKLVVDGQATRANLSKLRGQ